jgi:hypothetical protein
MIKPLDSPRRHLGSVGNAVKLAVVLATVLVVLFKATAS